MFAVLWTCEQQQMFSILERFRVEKAIGRSLLHSLQQSTSKKAAPAQVQERVSGPNTKIYFYCQGGPMKRRDKEKWTQSIFRLLQLFVSDQGRKTVLVMITGRILSIIGPSKLAASRIDNVVPSTVRAYAVMDTDLVGHSKQSSKITLICIFMAILYIPLNFSKCFPKQRGGLGPQPPPLLLKHSFWSDLMARRWIGSMRRTCKTFMNMFIHTLHYEKIFPAVYVFTKYPICQDVLWKSVARVGLERQFHFMDLCAFVLLGRIF